MLERIYQHRITDYVWLPALHILLPAASVKSRLCVMEWDASEIHCGTSGGITNIVLVDVLRVRSVYTRLRWPAPLCGQLTP